MQRLTTSKLLLVAGGEPNVSERKRLNTIAYRDSLVSGFTDCMRAINIALMLALSKIADSSSKYPRIDKPFRALSLLHVNTKLAAYLGDFAHSLSARGCRLPVGPYSYSLCDQSMH